MKIIFLGTPDFAVASLDAIIRHGFEVIAVVTSPDKPAGRGQKLAQSAVKKYAEQHQLPILQPTNLKNTDFIHQLRSYNADIQVVVAFRMLPEVVWNMPPKGTINLHASLLPQYRGAAPINHAIIQGERESGVSTFLLQHEIDTGHILLSQSVAIRDSETAGELHDKLMQVGAQLLVQTLQKMQEGNLGGKPQVLHENLKHAPKLSKDFCKIDWHQDIQVVYNHIRGLSPYPAAFTMLQGKILKIFSADKIEKQPLIAAGTFETDGKTFLRFATNNGFLELKEIQMEGKKRMSVVAFLRGAKLQL